MSAGRRRKPQRGVALITAVLIVALSVIAAAGLFTSSNLALHRASSLQDTEAAWWYAIGVENWVRTILQRDAGENQVDSLQDIWAQPVDFLPVDQGALRGQVIDLQGRFNLNNFATGNPQSLKQQIELFRRLLQQLELEPYQANVLALAIRDWIDADQNPTPDGAEDSDYLSMQPPYRTAGQLMRTPTELMAIRGMTKETYAALLPYVCALPVVDAPININTAPDNLLRALVGQTSSDLEQFLLSRSKEPVASVQALAGLLPAGVDRSLLTTRSQFFQLRAEAAIGNSRVAIYSLYFRPSQGAPLVLSRSTDSE